MIAIHCNRCGRAADDLIPELPLPDASPLARAGASGEQGLETAPFLVCAECLGLDGPYRFCTRCGQETPPSELKGGYCDWCRVADDIPFEEPADDAWWEGKTPGATPPSWWPRV